MYNLRLKSILLTDSFTITPLNETAALVSFGNTISVEANRKVIDLHHELKKQSFEGFVESVPAYSSLAVFYKTNFTFDFVKSFLEKRIASQEVNESELSPAILELPVLYDGEDLDFIAQQHHLTCDEVISIHTSKAYRVFMIGFLPGFPYMGSVDERIATSRKSSPRIAVPAGSVGIAGIQTGIYPQSSPGGWQLIGRTPLKIFDVMENSPCLFSPGDSVKFHSISKTEFEKLNEY